ncbi:MAG TPA: histidinol dehydrogenase, partial [Solirubrobacteraceae bacterium]|nr:histidinol dehydrogenase [Solirubrobacteraceae bacterium]
MRYSRLSGGPELAGALRELVPAATDVAEAVAAIVADVRAHGDEALREYTERFDCDPAPAARVPAAELDAALATLDPAVHAGLETAIANVAAVGWGSAREPREVDLPQGHRVLVRELPVERAAIYVPGGQAPYPSTVVMGVVTARAAGVREVVVCTPPPVDPALLAA